MHGVHNVDPDVEVKPRPHCVQFTDPLAVLKLPGAQGVQVADPGDSA